MLVKTSLLVPTKVVQETMKSNATMQAAQVQSRMAVWMIGTKTTLQVWATNCPADLHTATANLILLKQQRNTINNSPASEKQVYPKALY